MPRSHGVLKVEVWEAASDFRRLTLDAQWAYAMLVSQPQINNLGVLPYLPEKWHRLAVDLDPGRLADALGELEIARYTVTDEETGELLVRTFIKHDAVWKQPTLVTNARKLWRETESSTIRGYLADRHPWLVDATWDAKKITRHETTRRRPETPSDTPPETPPDTPPETPPDTPTAEHVENQREKPLTEGVSPPRARAQDALPQPLGQPQPLPPQLATTAEAEDLTRAHFEQPASANHTLEPNKADPIIRLVLELRDRDPGTERVLRANFGGLPEAAFAYAREEVLRCRRAGSVDSEAGLATRVLERVAQTGIIGDPDHAPPPTAAEPGPAVDLTERARQLYHDHDAEFVADWLAGIPTLSTTDRERILHDVTQVAA